MAPTEAAGSAQPTEGSAATAGADEQDEVQQSLRDEGEVEADPEPEEDPEGGGSIPEARVHQKHASGPQLKQHMLADAAHSLQLAASLPPVELLNLPAGHLTLIPAPALACPPGQK